MRLRLTSRRTALSAAAAALIAAAPLLFGNSAQAASNSAALDALLPLLAKAAAGARVASKAQVLPAPTGEARPFRQTLVGNCSFDSPLANLSGFTFCRFPAIAVAANRLLEIKNVSCLVLPLAGAFFLSKSGKVENLFSSLVGIVINATASPQGGPFYVAPGEKIFMWGLGQPESPAFCTVHGLLSPTD